MESAEYADGKSDKEPRLVVIAEELSQGDPLMKNLKDLTHTRTDTRIWDWEDDKVMGKRKRLISLAKAIGKQKRQCVLLVDEISDNTLLAGLEDEGIPDSVRMILIMNPMSRHNDTYGDPITKPLPDFEHVTLTTPYRSTIAITKLARFITECEEVALPDEDYGSDVEGIKPIFFDTGSDERKIKEALEYCHRCFGDDVTILYDGEEDNPGPIDQLVMSQGKKAGGPWEYYHSLGFNGAEAERVVAVTSRGDILEEITKTPPPIVIL